MEQVLLQPDVLEVIFSYLDGKSLESFVEVCTTWKSVIHHISLATNIWELCCKEEIIEEVLIDITSNLYPSWRPGFVEIIDWHVIYKCWHNWRHVGKVPYTSRVVFTAENVDQFITSLKISGNCVVTGHKRGGIHVWSCFKRLLGAVAKHLDSVTDLGLMSLTGKTAKTFHADWDLKHEYVVSTSEDHRVQVNLLQPDVKPVAVITHHMARTTMVRVFRNIFAVLSDDERVSVWKMDLNATSQVKITLIYSCRVYPDILKTISFWQYKLTGITRKGKHICLDDFSLDNPEQYLRQERHVIKEASFLPKQRGIILQEYIWRNSIGMSLSDRNRFHLAIYKGGIHSCSPMEALEDCPTSLLLYGQMLLLGMNTGTIFMYYIKEPEDILKLNLKDWCWTHSVCKFPIVLLDISDDLAQPTIVAATSREIFTVALVSSNKNGKCSKEDSQASLMEENIVTFF